MKAQAGRVLSVSALTLEVKSLIEGNFPAVAVTGEITGFKKHQSGHWYFSLRDAGAVLPAAMFRSANLTVRIEPKDGMEVIARGDLNVYPPQGRYQLIVQQLLPKGVGARELALRQLLEKLAAKGYFRPERKRELPLFPKRIALVTSPTGAAVRDILEVLRRRWPAVELWICPVHVQGESAAGEIADAFARLQRVGGVDVIIVGRGGGSTEDLSAFDDERVADAVFQARVPVVSAVGHEIDLTVVDRVADVRALTPSEAAELVVPNRMDLLEGLDGAAARMSKLLWTKLTDARQRLDDMAERRVFRRPLDRVRELEQRLDGLDDRLRRGAKQEWERKFQAMRAIAGHLESLSPLNVLGRGYSLTRRALDQQLVRAADQVRPGELLVTRVQLGEITSRVEQAVTLEQK
jgi:exodeoxyribonuclease VII large subunit